MALKQITAIEAKQMVDTGALLVDIREPNEYLAESIPGARNEPLSRFAGADLSGAEVVVFHCKSGARTRMNAGALAASVEGDAYLLDGGIDAWRAAGFPVK